MTPLRATVRESSEHRHPDGSTNQIISTLKFHDYCFFQYHSLWLLQASEEKKDNFEAVNF